MTILEVDGNKQYETKSYPLEAQSPIINFQSLTAI